MVTARREAAVYNYSDEGGHVLYQVVRSEPKAFTQRVPLGRGQFEYKLNGVRRVPYRLAEMLAAKATRTVFVTEGEKDAETLVARKCVATTNAGGASWRWTPEFVELFRGAKHVIVIPDCDEGDVDTGGRKGREAARERSQQLAAVAQTVRIVDLAPDQHNGYDVTDWFTDGHTVPELAALASRSEPIKPSAAPPPMLVAAPPLPAEPEEIRWDDARPWPTLDPAALHGLAGDFVRIVAPESEADVSALLTQFLCTFGCGVGLSAHVMVEATRHPARLNVVVVGATAGGRKGTAMGQVDRVFRIADEAWLKNAHVSGLASGEGLIGRLRDREEGVASEKRLLVVEPEFARTLAACSRDGSTLGAIIRDAWDSGRLQNLTRKDPFIAEGCHVAIIGHITADEFKAKLSTTDIANGFVNRFAIVCAKRRQRLPHGGNLDAPALAPLAKQLRTALDFGRQVGRVHRTPAANEAWEKFYKEVPEPYGLLGSVTARAEAQVLRLSLIYALLDGSAVIDVVHLRAAEALWLYAYESAQYVFGSLLGDKVADGVLRKLQENYPEGVDRDQLFALFSKHVTGTELTAAIQYLVKGGLARTEKVKTSGRSRDITFAIHRSEVGSDQTPSDLSSLNSLNSLLVEHEATAGTKHVDIGEIRELSPLYRTSEATLSSDISELSEESPSDNVAVEDRL